MTFNIFDSPTKEGIDVGYISDERGYVTNVSICEANEYAKSNPGTVFIVKNRDFVKYLDINEVNALIPQDLVPKGTDVCAGYIDIDENGNPVGVAVTEGGVDLEYEPVCGTSVHFYGGGGVGAHANPIVGSDGAVLAVDVVRGGFGYQYEPLVELKDTCGIGVGTKAKAFIDTQGVTVFQYYDDGLDVEEYKICDDDIAGFGRRYSADGKDLGPWDPEIYRREAEKTDYQRAVDDYNKALAEYKKPWFTGRGQNPSEIRVIFQTSNGMGGTRTVKEKFDVTHENWSAFMNKYAISPVPPSNVAGSDKARESFTFEWEKDFPTEGEYIFRGLYDGAENFADFYIDDQKVGVFGKSNENPSPIKKIYTKGKHKLSFILKNNTFKKPGAIQPNVSNIVDQNQGFDRSTGGTEEIRFEGLHPANNPIIVASNGKELRLKDGDGNDANARFIITAGNGVFSADGRSIEGKGDAILRLEWNDRERTAGVAIEKIRIGDKVWTRSGRSGSEIHTIEIGNKLKYTATRTTADVSYGDDVPASSIEIRSIFNTKDYIDKASRELWKLNNSNGFMGIYGISPFNPGTRYTTDKAGTHTIIWNTITFPISANYKIEVQVDDNVRLRIGDQVDIYKDGFDFSIASLKQVSSGKSTYTRFIRKGTYQITADVEQTAGGPLGYTRGKNPIALGVNIETEIVEEDVLDSKSWNENPLGVALSIESPLPLPPAIPIPESDGGCPPNPIWSTRSPGSEEVWHPVVGFPFWSKFLNQYALSPLPPLSTSGSDGTGVVYRNSWTVNLPYSGAYGLKGAVDNWGRILIDGVPYQRFMNEELSTIEESPGLANETLAGPTQKKQPLRRIELEGGDHTITVEVENWKDYESPRTFIDKKIFSTKDWQSADPSPRRVYADVTFKTTTASLYANSIIISGLFSESKEYGAGKDINVSNTYSVEKGRVYDVQFTSNITTQNAPNINYVGLNAANNPINVTNNGTRLALKDGDGTDPNASFTIDSVTGGTASFAADGRSINHKGDDVKITLTLSWNDNPRRAGVAVQRITFGDKVWTQSGRSGSQTHTVSVTSLTSTQNNNSNIKLRNKGDNVVQMEDLPDNVSDWDWQDIMCVASEGRFYDFNGNTCKYVIGNDVNTSSTRNGVVYKGPKLFNYKHSSYGSFIRNSGVSPDYPKVGGLGEIVTYEWSNVDFDVDGEYEFHFANDAHGSLYLDGQEIIRGSFDQLVGVSEMDSSNWTIGQRKKIQVTKGKHTISARGTNITSGAHAGNVDGLFTKLTSDYYRGSQAFDNNPSAFAVSVTRKNETFPVAGSDDIRLGKSWEANPMAISAVLIPAPCQKNVDGKGVVTRVEIIDGGTGFPDPPPTGIGTGYPVTLKLVDIVPTNPGIGYTGGVGIGITPDNDAKFKPIVDPFGRIIGVTTISTGIGFTAVPIFIITPPGPPDDPGIGTPSPPSPPFDGSGVPYTGSGVNARFRPVFEVVRDPLDVRPDQLIQVTDLVGLKQTGYYDGRPYYGSVFYRDGIRYAGQYQTAGDLIQVYDTLQESIDARITTPPSAILRQGTDTNSNNPRLNIPDTPENLT